MNRAVAPKAKAIAAIAIIRGSFVISSDSGNLSNHKSNYGISSVLLSNNISGHAESAQMSMFKPRKLGSC